MAADTATPSALDKAIDIDAASLFIGSLVELPMFAGQYEALKPLERALAAALAEWKEKHGLEEEIDGGDRLDELGLWAKEDHLSSFLVDPGFGRDMALLYEKLRSASGERHGCPVERRGPLLGRHLERRQVPDDAVLLKRREGRHRSPYAEGRWRSPSSAVAGSRSGSGRAAACHYSGTILGRRDFVVVMRQWRQGPVRSPGVWTPIGVVDDLELAATMADLVREAEAGADVSVVSADDVFYELRSQDREHILDRLNSRTTDEIQRDLALRRAAAARLAKHERRAGDRRSGPDRRSDGDWKSPGRERRARGDRRSSRDRRQPRQQPDCVHCRRRALH